MFVLVLLLLDVLLRPRTRLLDVDQLLLAGILAVRFDLDVADVSVLVFLLRFRLGYVIQAEDVAQTKSPQRRCSLRGHLAVHLHRNLQLILGGKFQLKRARI